MALGRTHAHADILTHRPKQFQETRRVRLKAACTWFKNYKLNNNNYKLNNTVERLFSRATNFTKRAKALFCGNYFRGLTFSARAATYMIMINSCIYVINYFSETILV